MYNYRVHLYTCTLYIHDCVSYSHDSETFPDREQEEIRVQWNGHNSIIQSFSYALFIVPMCDDCFAMLLPCCKLSGIYLVW